MDYFRKWPEAYGLPNQDAVTVSRALMENWVCCYGLPLEMHSNKGRNFESNLFHGIRPEPCPCIPNQTEWSNASTEPWSSICRTWLTNIKGTGTDIYHCSCWRIEQRSTKRHTKRLRRFCSVTSYVYLAT
jgi:hypothetical protein